VAVTEDDGENSNPPEIASRIGLEGLYEAARDRGLYTPPVDSRSKR
jgi:hypothetical protein